LKPRTEGKKKKGKVVTFSAESRKTTDQPKKTQTLPGEPNRGGEKDVEM